jgi:glycyl-tRNA synthetase beta chain
MRYFVIVRNGDDRSLDVVRAGNEKVIRARFADAEFFYGLDTKTTLWAKVSALDGIVYQDKLGTLRQRADRLAAISAWLTSAIPSAPAKVIGIELAKRAALLAKADLSTHMVIELPTLQGQVGREYALLDGEDPSVANAIAEHYEMAPTAPLSRVVAIADRIDALAAHFGIGVKPTGSSDPFGLRRAATSLYMMLSESPVDLAALLDCALDQLVAQRLLALDRDAVRRDLLAYLAERAEALLIEHGARYDVAQAVVSAGFENLPRAIARALVLDRMRSSDSEFAPVTIAATRLVNLMNHAAEKGMTLSDDSPDASKYVEPLEGELDRRHAEMLRTITDLGETDLPAYYEQVYRILQPLRETIDAYFDKSSNIMVMADDVALRDNRLKLLREIDRTYKILCDFSKIVQDQA